MVDCKRIQFRDMHVYEVSNFQNVTYVLRAVKRASKFKLKM